MDDSSGQPPGAPSGQPNMKSGLPGQYPQQGQQIMRPQGHQYGAGPSYQAPPNQSMQGQYHRQPYQHSMPNAQQHHKQQSQPNIQHSSMINQHTNLPVFNPINQGSPLNPQQMSSQLTGSPYQMMHDSPAGGMPRYNSPQMPNQQLSSQSLIQSQQMHPQMSQQYSQQQPNMHRYPQMPMQSQPHQQQHSQQNAMQQHQKSQQQIYQQSQKSLPPQHNFPPQQTPSSQPSFHPEQQQQQQSQMPFHQSQQQQQPSQSYSMLPQHQQNFHHSQQQFASQSQPQTGQPQYQQQQAIQKSPQMSSYPLHQSPIPQSHLQPQQLPSQQQQQQQHHQFAIPAPLQSQQPSLSAPHPLLQQSSSPVKQLLIPNIPPKKEGESSNASPPTNKLSLSGSVPPKTNQRRPPIICIRRPDPRKNLLMNPKASALKSEKDSRASIRNMLKKNVRWAPTLRIRHPHKFIKRRLKTRYLAPASPPIMMDGHEVQMASKLMQPVYHGELVVGKRKKGVLPISARLIGGKIVKPYNQFLQIANSKKRLKTCRNTLRRMANERSFTMHQQIETGEMAPFNTAISASEIAQVNRSVIPALHSSSDLPREIDKESATKTFSPLKSLVLTASQSLLYHRTFCPLSIKPQFSPKKTVLKPKILSETEKKEKEEMIKILNSIPWRTLPRKSKKSVLPRIWHPPIALNKGWIVLPKNECVSRPVSVWHPPLSFPPTLLQVKRKKVFKIDGKIASSSSSRLPSKDLTTDSASESKRTINFASPTENIIIDGDAEIDATKVAFCHDKVPIKSSLSLNQISNNQQLCGDEVMKNGSKKNQKTKIRGESPPLVNMKYPRPSFIIPSLQRPPPSTAEPIDSEPVVDLTKNPMYNQKKIITRLDEQRCVNLLYEYRLAQVKQVQPKNMWEANNHKMIDLMKTKGAGIDSAVREDAGKALKFLEDKALKLTGKHSEIRNKLLQFCLDYGYEYVSDSNDNFFYLNIGDFTVQLELQEYLVKDAWFFWSNIEPIYAPTIAKMFHQDLWSKIHASIDRMRHIIPISLTSEEKDLVLRGLCCMERDLIRYHTNVEFRSHIFALNDILPRNDVHPFSIILPRSSVEIARNEKTHFSALDKFENVKNVATLQIQLSPLERHKFCIQSSLTPSNQWATPDSYKVGARFMIKFAKPIPLRYGAMKQLQSISGGIISKENYVNVYKSISLMKHGKLLAENLSDYSKNFVMYFDFDNSEKEARNDSIINGFYIDKASQICSAMYIIKREYILNRLCESTCENNPDLIEWRHLCTKNKKVSVQIRLADIFDGRMCLYFLYRCYIVEAIIIIQPAGNVGLECLRIAHHGHQLGTSYHTVSNYHAIIDKHHLTDPIFLTDSQLSELNVIIQDTWHIPAFIDQLIKIMRKRCTFDDDKEIHDFSPVFLSDKQYKKDFEKFAASTNYEVLSSIFKQKKKVKESCKKMVPNKKRPGDDEDDPSMGSFKKSLTTLQQTQLPTSQPIEKNKENSNATGATSEKTKAATQKMSLQKKLFRKNLICFFRDKVKGILQQFKKRHQKSAWLKWNKMISTTNKLERNGQKLRLNRQLHFQKRLPTHQRNQKMADNFFSKKQHLRAVRKRRSLLKRRKIIKNKHGSAWNNFIFKVNEYDQYFTQQHTLITLPMLADQRIINRLSNSNSHIIKSDPQIDDAGRIEELDEYFNVSDCEDNGQICSYSFIPRKIVPPISKKSINCPMTIDNAVEKLKPKTRKFLAKFYVKMDKKTDVGSSNLNEDETEMEQDDKNVVEWGEEWKNEDYSTLHKYLNKKRQTRKKRNKRKINNVIRPTSFRFFSILNRDKLQLQGLFPHRALRHAAICLRDGPFKEEPRKPLIPKSLIARYKMKLLLTKKRRKDKKRKEAKKSRAAEQLKQKATEKTSQEKEGAEATLINSNINKTNNFERKQKSSGNNKVAKTTNPRKSRSLFKLKPLMLPPPPPLPAMTLSQKEDHKRLILYFDQKMQKHDVAVYIEELRSRLMAIWIYFKPFITTARAFERMLEIYGPEAIYNQLQFHRRNLDIEKQRKDQQNEFQRKQKSQNQGQRSYPLSISTHVRSQTGESQIFSQQHPQLPHSDNAMSSQPLAHTSLEGQNQFAYKSQELFADSSSSSVSTPTSAGPLQSPFTPTGKRRGRGRGANFGTRMPSDQHLMGPPLIMNDMQKAKRGRPRKSLLMTSNSHSSQESPLPRPQMSQSPYHSASLQSNPFSPQINSSYSLNSSQTNASVYPAANQSRSTMPPLQPSPLALQNATTPQKVMPQYPSMGRMPPQEYYYESSSDEETDPPPPRPLPTEPANMPIKLKVDLSQASINSTENSKEIVPLLMNSEEAQQNSEKEISSQKEHDQLSGGKAIEAKSVAETSNEKEKEIITSEKDVLKEKSKHKEREMEKERETTVERETVKEREKEKEKIKSKEKVKEKEKSKERRHKEKERERKKNEAEAAVKSQKLDKKDKDRQKLKKINEEIASKVNSKGNNMLSEKEMKESSTVKKAKKLKSPEPIFPRLEKEKNSKEKRELDKDKERAKIFAEYEEERARKKRKAESRAEKEKYDKGKIEKSDKLEKAKAEKLGKDDPEAERKKERKDKKDIKKNEKEEKGKLKIREDKEKSKITKNDDKDKLFPSISSGMPLQSTSKKRRRSAVFDDEESKEPPYTPALQMHRSPSKIPKLNYIDRTKVAEQIALKKRQKEIELAKLEKDKKRLGITPDIEPLSKKLKEVAETNETATQPKKIEMVQFFPEAGVLVEIPHSMVKTLHSIQSLLSDSKNPESTQKMIDRAKQRCLENLSRPHAEISNILDDMKNLEIVLEAAQAKQKRIEVAASSITAMSAAASAGVSKEEAEKLAAEKEANLKTTQMRIQQAKAIKEKEKKAKLKAAADAAAPSKNSNLGKSPLDSSDVLSRILDTNPITPKNVREKYSKKDETDPKNAATRAAMAAAEDEALMQSVVGVPNLGEALKTFKIPKVQDAAAATKEIQLQDGKLKELEKERDHDREKDKARGRDREKEHRERDREDDSDRDRDHRDRERDRDRRHNDNIYGRRYSSDHDRKYDGDRRFSNEGKFQEDRRYDEYSHDYSGSRGFHHRGGGYQPRKNPRSPRSDYERRGAHYHSNRGRGGGGGGGYRGRGNYRDSSRDHWKGSSSSSNQHDEFYEGLPPKQAQINREALDESDYHNEAQSRYRHNAFDVSGPIQTFSNTPARKVLLPNRIGGDGSVRPSSWNQPTFFNPNVTHGPSTSLPLLSSTPPSFASKSTSDLSNVPSTLSSDNSLQEVGRKVSRPRESRDSPPEVGLQIDESD